MDSEAKADALEDFMTRQLNEAVARNQGAGQNAAKKFPTVAEIEAQIDTRHYRRGAGNLFVARTDNVRRSAIARVDNP